MASLNTSFVVFLWFLLCFFFLYFCVIFVLFHAIHLFSVFVWKHSNPCAWWYEVDFIWWCGLVWWYVVNFSLVCWRGQSLLIFRVSELVSMFMIYVVLGDLVNLNRTYMMMRIIIWWIMAMATIITIVQKWQFPFPSKFNDEAHVWCCPWIIRCELVLIQIFVGDYLFFYLLCVIFVNPDICWRQSSWGTWAEGIPRQWRRPSVCFCLLKVVHRC